MPFGKHKGAPLSAVPDDYLAWLAARDDLREPLQSAVARELQARGHGDTLLPLATRLQQAQARGYFVVQAGREEEAGAYQDWCIATGTPSLCVALDGQTATIALAFLGVCLPQRSIRTILQGLEARWDAYSPHHLPPSSFVLVRVPRKSAEAVAVDVGALAQEVCTSPPAPSLGASTSV